MWRASFYLVAMGLLAGCAKEEPTRRQGGVEVNVPGVQVKVAPDGKTEVKTPGGDVRVDPDK